MFSPANLSPFTVVWEKFTIEYFCVKIIYGKIVSSLGVSDEKFLNQVHAWFLKIEPVRIVCLCVCVSVCVCVSTPEAINN